MRHEWQRRRKQASHTDDWLMTYADMITLLLCFFAIFLSVTIPQKGLRQNAAIPQPIAQPVKLSDPMADALPQTQPMQTQVPQVQLMDDKEGARKAADSAAEAASDNAIPASGQGVQEQNEPQVDKPSPAITVGVLSGDVVPADAPDPSYAALLEIVNQVKAQGPSSIDRQGDRITTLQINSAAFFGSGSAALSDSGRSILKAVATNINSEKYRDYRITVEGHTDDSPISTLQFPSNWELSTARAAAVVHFFLQQGIQARRLRAAGYADTFPMARNRDASGKSIPENQARNRRVVIKLEKIEEAE